MKRVIVVLAVAAAVVAGYFLLPTEDRGRRSDRNAAERGATEGDRGAVSEPVGKSAATELARGDASLAISVTEGGAPAPGAELRVRDPFGREIVVEADSRGRRELRNVTSGSYSVRARKGDARGAASVDVAGSSACSVDLKAALTVRGTVRDAYGKPIDGAFVEAIAGGARAQPFDVSMMFRRIGMPDPVVDAGRSAADGTYELRLPGRGAYAVRAWTSRHAQEVVRTRTFARDETGLDFHLLAAAPVEGRVLDTAREPIAGARVFLVDAVAAFAGTAPKMEATTDAGGRFRFAVQPGAAEEEFSQQLIVARAPGYAVTVRSDIGIPSRDVELILDRGITVTMRCVEAEASDRPVAGVKAAVVYGASYAEGQSGADGRVFLRQVGTHDPEGDDTKSAILTSPRFVPRVVPLAGFAIKDGVLDAGEVALERGGTVRGVVRDADTGRPIAGARIRAFGGDAGDMGLGGFGGDVAESDAEGRYELFGVPLQAMVLFVSHPDYPTDADALMQRMMQGFGGNRATPRLFPEGTNELERDLVLTAGTELRGVVVDARGRPVEGATVTARSGDQDAFLLMFGGGIAPVLTDARGGFVVRPLKRGASIRLTASHPDYGPSKPKDVEVGGNDVELALSDPIIVTGIVHGAEGEPLAGVRVSVMRGEEEEERDFSAVMFDPEPIARPGVTDAGGRFVIRNAPADATGLSCDHPDFRPKTHPVTLRGDAKQDVGVIRLDPGASIAGVVLGPDGKPAAGVDVSVSAETGYSEIVMEDDESLEETVEVEAEEPEEGRTYASGTTDEQGRFRLRGLADGEFELSASREGCYFRSRKVAAGSEDLRLQLREAGSLSGIVVANGRPVAGVSVSAAFVEGDETNYFAWETTDSEGRFRLETLPPTDAFRLEIESESHKTLVVDGVTASPSERTFRLETGRVIDGIVVDESGRGLAGVHVSVHPKPPESPEEAERMFESFRASTRSAVTGEDGRFRVSGCEEGELQVSPDFENETHVLKEPVSIAAGESHARVVAVPALKISGRVHAASGVDPSEAWVGAINGDGDYVAHAQISEEGDFELRGLAAGVYRITVALHTDDGEERYRGEVVGVRAGATGVVVDLRAVK